MSQASKRLIYFWAWFPLIASLLSFAQGSFTQNNVTVHSNASQIVYTPFLCVDFPTDAAQECESAWRTIDISGTTFVSTNGPAPGSLIPQMFFEFRASALYLSTSYLSNATTNLTVSNNGTVLSAVFNSSVGMVSILNLLETELSTVALTFIKDSALPTRLDVGIIILTVTDDRPSSVILPSMTLPASPTLPTFGSATPSASSTSVSASSDHRTLVAEAVGITLGLSLGLTVVAVLGFLIWRRRRRRRPPGDYDTETSQSMRSAWPPTSQTQARVTSSGWAARAFKGHDTAQDQSEMRRWS